MDEINENDIIEVDFEKGFIKNLNTKKTYKFPEYPEFLQNIINSGGLMSLAKI